MPDNPKRFILCEGPSDRAFLQALMQARGIVPAVIRYPNDKAHDAITRPPRGISGFHDLIEGLKIGTEPKFGTIERIMVMADNDGTPAENFAAVIAQLTQSFPNRAMPQAPLQRIPGKPTLEVMMLPLDGSRGNLETCCVAAAHSTNADAATAVHTFAAMLPAARRAELEAKPEIKGKFELVSSFAVRSSNPSIWLAKAVSETSLVPLKHKSFDAIAAAIGNFVS